MSGSERDSAVIRTSYGDYLFTLPVTSVLCLFALQIFCAVPALAFWLTTLVPTGPVRWASAIVGVLGGLWFGGYLALAFLASTVRIAMLFYRGVPRSAWASTTVL